MKPIPVAALTAILALTACSDAGGSTNSATHTISGTVSGAIAEGVTISLSGAMTKTTTTDASGNYSFGALANGIYTVAPSMTGFAFSPVSIAVTVNGGDVTGQNFTASTASATYAISGTVSGQVVAGVTVTLSGANSGSTITDASGNYSFSGLSIGSYTLTPTFTGFTFTPPSIAVDVAGADVTGQDFNATAVVSTYTISGTVSGDVAAGVTVILGGDAGGTTITDVHGNYSFSGLQDGNYSVTPSMMEFTFTPTSLSVSVNGADVAAQDFMSTFSGLTLTIVTFMLPQGRIGHPYTATVVAMGGVEPYVFSGVGLPSWLTLASDGTFSGTPDATGTFTFTVTVTDDNGAGVTTSKDLSITVVGH